MIDELVKTVRLHLSERLTSPLFGAFAVSWCIWNYRTIMVGFSSENVLEKFRLLDQVVYPDAYHSLGLGLVLPAITASAYLFAYPYPAKYVYEFTRRKQREILEIRRRIEGETPLTIEDSKRIRNELVRAEESYYSDLDRKDSEIEKLRGLLAASTSKQPSESKQTTPSPSDDLTAAMLDMLDLIDKSNGQLYELAAPQRSGLSKTEAEFVLGELLRRGLVSRGLDRTAGKYLYKFTHEGRAAWLSNRAARASA